VVVHATRPHVSIGQLAIGGDITNIDLTVIAELERRVEEMPSDDEAKEKARSTLRRVREAAEGVGTSAAGDLIEAALRQVLGLGYWHVRLATVVSPVAMPRVSSTAD
jgi:hypothetical protein